MDKLSPEQRSNNMRRVRSRDTLPERKIRSGLHRMGFRFRVHARDLPGKPDIVLPRYNAVILVNGCFWHGHNCAKTSMPKSNAEFWRQKIGENRKRDKRVERQLVGSGWRVFTIWGCEVTTKASLVETIELLASRLRDISWQRRSERNT